MKLDRNINPDGRGKYALLNLRNCELSLDEIHKRITEAVGGQVLQFGDNENTEFFVIKLKDAFAAEALHAYAGAAIKAGFLEYATEIRELAWKAENHPLKKLPD